jgi:hypothetical protein
MFQDKHNENEITPQFAQQSQSERAAMNPCTQRFPPQGQRVICEVKYSQASTSHRPDRDLSVNTFN